MLEFVSQKIKLVKSKKLFHHLIHDRRRRGSFLFELTNCKDSEEKETLQKKMILAF